MARRNLNVAAESRRPFDYARRADWRTHLIAASAITVAGVFASLAFAASPTIQVNPNPVHRGEFVRVHGVVPGCARGNSVTLISRAFSHAHDFAGLPAVFAPIDRHHRYSVRTRIPAQRRPGRYRITGRCGGGNLGVSVRLRVLS